MVDQIRRLVNLGLPIIPLCSHNHEGMSTRHTDRCLCAGKTPLIGGWQKWNSTTMDDLRSWQMQFKSFNVGLPLGSASGYCGIDCDGMQAESILQGMSNGDLPPTWEFTTGNGRRLLYLIPEGLQTKKFTKKGDGKHEEVALLCEGQQTVVPPSVHFTGRKYEWTEGRSPWDLDCAPAPAWLVQLIKAEDSFASDLNTGTMSFEDSVRFYAAGSMEDEFTSGELSDKVPDGTTSGKEVKRQGRSGHKIVVTDELLTQNIPEGQRDNTMTAIVGHYCANRDLRRLGKPFILELCQKHNQKYCDPPLDAKTIEDKVNYFYDAEMMKDAKYKEQREAKPVFRASKMAAIVKNKLQTDGLLLHFDQSSKMYYYTLPKKGPWVCTRNTTLINKWIRKIITHSSLGCEEWDKQGYIDETRRALEELYTEAFKQLDDFDLGAHADKLCDLIVVKNGMVNWQTGELTPWNPDYFTTVSFDLDYDATATCPRFEQFMTEWLPNQEVRNVVQEYLGYCLIPNTHFRKALFMYGKGKNGKSMLLEFLQEFFGENKSSISYDSLFQRFGPANLKGKMVNIFDDTSVSFVKDTGIIKNLIAGGTIAAEFKGKDHFIFTNVARFIFSAQETPKTSDHTEAWYDRWIFVKFPNRFRPSNEKKIEIQTAMREEISGIFNWMLTGLRRLMEQDGFTTSEELLVSAQEYRAVNDSVALFIKTMCTSKPATDGTTINTLYKVYCTWADLEGLRPISKRTFSERMEDLGYEKKKGYAENQSGQTFFKGIFVNKESEDYQDNALEYSITAAVR